jgi:hypothetical protein
MEQWQADVVVAGIIVACWLLASLRANRPNLDAIEKRLDMVIAELSEIRRSAAKSRLTEREIEDLYYRDQLQYERDHDLKSGPKGG